MTQVEITRVLVDKASLTVDADGNKRTSVSVLIDNKEFVLCTLVPNKIEQQPLDITFVEGEEVTFSAKGSNAVHLTGNYVFHDDDEGDMGSMGDESEEEDNVEEFLK
ncbi:Putative FK506-binding protein 4 [Rhizopus microsporus]|nr:Putative FK506-binding protein 4 [Rhizopus microsporus]